MSIVFKRRCDNDFVNERLSSIKSENFSAKPSYKKNDSKKESANPPIKHLLWASTAKRKA